MIVDSGERRQFETGAVRDIQEGKGRCDLLPLDVVSEIYRETVHTSEVFNCLNNFRESGNLIELYNVLLCWIYEQEISFSDMLLEVSKHFEEGALKYGDRNWEKGIPVHCYIDSAVRHYLKWLRGDTDERHDRAFCWNILCCIWTMGHKPELDDFTKKGLERNES